MIKRHLTRGISLVELAIVLVVIGLVVGGIMVGQDIIRAASLTKIIKEKDEIATAIRLFSEKYGALPGDMKDATSYWGQDASCNCSRTTNGTCNGTGNLQVYDGGPWSGASATSSAYENNLVWQHLTLANLIPGKYSGICTYSVGVNNPPSNISKNVGWGFFYAGNGSIVNFYPANYGNFLHLATSSPIANTNGGITPSDASWLDTKMDDGRPQSGTVMAPHTGSLGQLSMACLNGSTSTSTYNLTIKTADCPVHFLIGF